MHHSEATGPLRVPVLSHLLLNPLGGHLHPVPQRRRRLPAQLVQDHRVVRVAAVDALRLRQVVLPIQIHLDRFLDHVDQPVDRHQLVGAEINRLGDIGMHDLLRPFHAVVDVHERAGLRPVAPDHDLLVAGELPRNRLAREGRRGLFPPAVVGAERTVHVVVARDAGREPEVLPEVAAHPLAEELLPAVAVFGQGRVGIRLRKRLHIGGVLLLGVVDAGAGGVEEAIDIIVPRGHQQMRVDAHAEHTQGLVVLDEAHPAHVGSEVVDLIDVLQSAVAILLFAQVERAVVRLRKLLKPAVRGLDVDRTDLRESLPEQVRHEVAADEAARPADDHGLVRVDIALVDRIGDETIGSIGAN